MMWQLDAACAQVGTPEMWQSEEPGDTKAAQAVCDVCPVKAACAEWAIVNKEESGIWGGMTPAARKRAIRARSLIDKHRYASHCVNGHPTPEGANRDNRGRCKTCMQIKAFERRQAAKGRP